MRNANASSPSTRGIPRPAPGYRTVRVSVGLDPVKDDHLGRPPRGRGTTAFRRGEGRCLLGLSPEPQELRAKKVGRVVVNTLTDRPWSQYFCCMLNATRELVRTSPVATKRVLRAVLKAADIYARVPERVARLEWLSAAWLSTTTPPSS
jgi:NitT/TauT family transport system substrate-binding protein